MKLKRVLLAAAIASSTWPSAFAALFTGGTLGSVETPTLETPVVPQMEEAQAIQSPEAPSLTGDCLICEVRTTLDALKEVEGIIDGFRDDALGYNEENGNRVPGLQERVLNLSRSYNEIGSSRGVEELNTLSEEITQFIQDTLSLSQRRLASLMDQVERLRQRVDDSDELSEEDQARLKDKVLDQLEEVWNKIDKITKNDLNQFNERYKKLCARYNGLWDDFDAEAARLRRRAERLSSRHEIQVVVIRDWDPGFCLTNYWYWWHRDYHYIVYCDIYGCSYEPLYFPRVRYGVLVRIGNIEIFGRSPRCPIRRRGEIIVIGQYRPFYRDRRTWNTGMIRWRTDRWRGDRPLPRGIRHGIGMRPDHRTIERRNERRERDRHRNPALDQRHRDQREDIRNELERRRREQQERQERRSREDNQRHRDDDRNRRDRPGGNDNPPGGRQDRGGPGKAPGENRRPQDRQQQDRNRNDRDHQTKGGGGSPPKDNHPPRETRSDSGRGKSDQGGSQGQRRPGSRRP